eukprot:TRINITY_DN23254_c0_g1_i1.p1 TRINITY_DN23254_c0_g1~~TRINITY_DN23254_c0_g1_i1.p1  ORF type:complete len:530 (+),score=85.63 TRINITY_DN23254_c0_g1_i1:73-1662(+)
MAASLHVQASSRPLSPNAAVGGTNPSEGHGSGREGDSLVGRPAGTDETDGTVRNIQHGLPGAASLQIIEVALADVKKVLANECNKSEGLAAEQRQLKDALQKEVGKTTAAVEENRKLTQALMNECKKSEALSAELSELKRSRSSESKKEVSPCDECSKLQLASRTEHEKNESLTNENARLMELLSKQTDLYDELRDEGRLSLKVLPYLDNLSAFLGDLSSLSASKDTPQLIPVSALRFTHHTVNASLAFGEDHENRQESIFKLFDSLFRGMLAPEEMEPLHVFLVETPTGGLGLFSRSNRRLLALQMFQAARREKPVMATCYLYTKNDSSPQSLAWFRNGYDAVGSHGGACTGEGLSVFARQGTARHRGSPLFNQAVSAKISLEHAVARAHLKENLPAEVLNKSKDFLRCVRVRRREGDEETLTLRSDPAATSAACSEVVPAPKRAREARQSPLEMQARQSPLEMLEKIGFPTSIGGWCDIQHQVWRDAARLPLGWIRVWSKSEGTEYYMRVDDQETTFDIQEVISDAL